MAQTDIVPILAWSHDQFGEEARKRYEALIATAIRDSATRDDEVGRTARPELGDGVFSWHLAQSRTLARQAERSTAPDTSLSADATATSWSSVGTSTTRWNYDATSIPSSPGSNRQR